MTPSTLDLINTHDELKDFLLYIIKHGRELEREIDELKEKVTQLETWLSHLEEGLYQ